MSTTHAPGPWTYWSDMKGDYAIERNDGTRIAEVFSRNRGDVALIAAAPELLAMLERLVPAPPSLDELDLGEEDNQLLDEARALIARVKATA